MFPICCSWQWKRYHRTTNTCHCIWALKGTLNSKSVKQWLSAEKKQSWDIQLECEKMEHMSSNGRKITLKWRFGPDKKEPEAIIDFRLLQYYLHFHLCYSIKYIIKSVKETAKYIHGSCIVIVLWHYVDQYVLTLWKAVLDIAWALEHV